MSRIVGFLVRIMGCKLVQKMYLDRVLSYIIRIVFSFQISPGARVGRNVTFGYGGLGTVVHGRVQIGDGTVIGSNVTIGGNFGAGNVPVIGRNCYIATGAKILGNVVIGDNAIIGANAVVIKDVPSNTVAAGIPAKVLRKI